MIAWTGLFVLCSVLSPALCCDWLKHWNRYSNFSLNSLRLMGGEPTTERCPVSFPYRLYEQIQKTQVESQLVFVRDSLSHIADLYRHDNLSSASWDAHHTEGFLMSVHRQIQELDDCVPADKRADVKLGRYYRRLSRATLAHTGGSAASWELIRRETTLHLEQLHLLVASIKAPAAASRRRSTPAQHRH